MELPSKSYLDLICMGRVEFDAYFEEYARYMPDAPNFKYAIKISGLELYSNDTYDLKWLALQEWRWLKRSAGSVGRLSCKKPNLRLK